MIFMKLYHTNFELWKERFNKKLFKLIVRENKLRFFEDARVIIAGDLTELTCDFFDWVLRRLIYKSRRVVMR